MGVEISIIYVCILIQELCLDCFKKKVFSQLKDVKNFQLDYAGTFGWNNLHTNAY